MPLKIEHDEDRAFLLQSVRRGDVVLILGAGASFTSSNSAGEPILMGRGLARKIAERCGLVYEDEPLKEVLAACVPNFLSEQQFHTLLREEYTNTKASAELIRLLNYTWRRIYTWNIDDTIESAPRAAQRRIYYNGMKDKVVVRDSLEAVEVVHLHGEAEKPEHDFIFSESEYNQALIERRHRWYRQLAQDYAGYVPVFIGSALEETVLSVELDRARPTPGAGLGRAYLITPNDMTPIQVSSLRSRNIIPLKGTLADLVDLLAEGLGASFQPADVAAVVSTFASSLLEELDLDNRSVETAKSIYRITWSAIVAENQQYPPEVVRRAAREFLEGSPPSWRIASTNVPVELAQTADLYRFLTRLTTERARLGVVTGQAGSGKSTALMQCLLRYSREHDDAPIYEVRGEVESLRSALQLLARIDAAEHKAVYISDLFVFGDSFVEDVLTVTGGRLTVFTSARTGEWRGRFSRQAQDFSEEFQFEKISQTDFDPLIRRLTEYVPSPRFQKLSHADRRKRLAESKSQLLIALKETTYSRRFTSVITREFEALPTYDCQMLLLICGLASISRTGISAGTAREAFESVSTQETFESARERLQGIVVEDARGRLSARHELYVRHIYENVAELQEIIDAMVAVLRTFTKYDHPIIKSVDRLDATLFRQVLNHNFLKEITRRRGALIDGVRLYQSFEVDFVLDGHFWLQYGQYLVEAGDMERALIMMQRSIDAYPDNEFAWHALADIQLKVATGAESYTAETRKLIGDAVDILSRQDEHSSLYRDYYAIVTLATGHVGALVRHGQAAAAKEAAGKYLRRITQIRREDPSEELQYAHDKLLRYMTTGEWSSGGAVHARKTGWRRR